MYSNFDYIKLTRNTIFFPKRVRLLLFC